MDVECCSEESLSGINKDIKSPKSHSCSGCSKRIDDQYVLRVNELYWHEKCLQCYVCRRSLADSCYSKDDKYFCRTDYRRLYGAKCETCKQPIAANELVMTALANLYHLHCFKCDDCGKSLEKGDEFKLKDNRLFCKSDFQVIKLERDSDSSLGSPDSSQTNCFPISPTASDKSSQDDKRSIKRPRTILTSHQRKDFKAAFDVSPKPCRKVREELSHDTGLSIRVVQVWFQNQRAKLKKLAKKSHPSSSSEHGPRRSGKGKRKARQKGESHQQTKSKMANMNTDPDTPPLTPLQPSRNQSNQMKSFESMSNVQDPYNQGPPPNMQPFYPTPPPPNLSSGNNYPTISQHGPPTYAIPQRDFPPDDLPPLIMDGGHMNMPMHYGPNMNHNYQDAIADAAAQNHLQLMHHMLNSF